MRSSGESDKKRVQAVIMRALRFLLTISLAFLLARCASVRPPTTAEYEHGLVWVFPGVEGGKRSVARAVAAFRDAGVEAAICVHDWWRPFGLVSNLASYERNRRDARRIALRIAYYRAGYPDTPVDLVGYSGGGGMAVMVAEELPADVRVRNIVLAQPALSPKYDLTNAMGHVDGLLVNHYSRWDFLVLGAGTMLLGTMDRVYGPSAGLTGFDCFSAVPDERLRRKLVQRAWSSRMIRQGHLGGHVWIHNYRWNKHCVAPYLVPPVTEPWAPP